MANRTCVHIYLCKFRCVYAFVLHFGVNFISQRHSVLFTRCTFERNVAVGIDLDGGSFSQGGALAVSSGFNVVARNSTFTHNLALAGVGDDVITLTTAGASGSSDSGSSGSPQNSVWLVSPVLGSPPSSPGQGHDDQQEGVVLRQQACSMATSLLNRNAIDDLNSKLISTDMTLVHTTKHVLIQRNFKSLDKSRFQSFTSIATAARYKRSAKGGTGTSSGAGIASLLRPVDLSSFSVVATDGAARLTEPVLVSPCRIGSFAPVSD